MTPRDELRQLLVHPGVTCARVGEKARVTPQAISAMQTGRLRVTENALRAAKEVLFEVMVDGLRFLMLGRAPAKPTDAEGGTGS